MAAPAFHDSCHGEGIMGKIAKKVLSAQESENYKHLISACVLCKPPAVEVNVRVQRQRRGKLQRRDIQAITSESAIGSDLCRSIPL